jgi:hypothetical protein
VDWCGVARNATFRRYVQAFAALCGLFAYSADLRTCRCVKVGIHKLFNLTAANLYLGSLCFCPLLILHHWRLFSSDLLPLTPKYFIDRKPYASISLLL